MAASLATTSRTPLTLPVAGQDASRLAQSRIAATRVGPAPPFSHGALSRWEGLLAALNNGKGEGWSDEIITLTGAGDLDVIAVAGSALVRSHDLQGAAVHVLQGASSDYSSEIADGVRLLLRHRSLGGWLDLESRAVSQLLVFADGAAVLRREAGQMWLGGQQIQAQGAPLSGVALDALPCSAAWFDAAAGEASGSLQLRHCV